MQVKLNSASYVRLKDGVLPRYFDCQKDRKLTPVEKPAAKKLRTMQTMAEIIEELTSMETSTLESESAMSFFQPAVNPPIFSESKLCCNVELNSCSESSFLSVNGGIGSLSLDDCSSHLQIY